MKTQWLSTISYKHFVPRFISFLRPLWYGNRKMSWQEAITKVCRRLKVWEQRQPLERGPDEEALIELSLDVTGAWNTYHHGTPRHPAQASTSFKALYFGNNHHWHNMSHRLFTFGLVFRVFLCNFVERLPRLEWTKWIKLGTSWYYCTESSLESSQELPKPLIASHREYGEHLQHSQVSTLPFPDRSSSATTGQFLWYIMFV